MPEFHEWRVAAGSTAGYCEMAICARPRAYRVIYSFQKEGMPIPEVRTWAVCALHARAWAIEKNAIVPEGGISLAPELIRRALGTDHA